VAKWIGVQFAGSCARAAEPPTRSVAARSARIIAAAGAGANSRDCFINTISYRINSLDAESPSLIVGSVYPRTLRIVATAKYAMQMIAFTDDARIGLAVAIHSLPAFTPSFRA
jgi:hypothetical protein